MNTWTTATLILLFEKLLNPCKKSVDKASELVYNLYFNKGNNMKPIGLFYTPTSMEEMQDILESLPARERALVYPYVMQMYNLLVSKLANQETAEA